MSYSFPNNPNQPSSNPPNLPVNCESYRLQIVNQSNASTEEEAANSASIEGAIILSMGRGLAGFDYLQSRPPRLILQGVAPHPTVVFTSMDRGLAG